MIFIGIALVIAAGLALVLADAGSVVGLSQGQTSQLTVMLIILGIAAASLFSRRYRFANLIGSLALWVGLFGVALVGYAFRDDLSGVAARVFGELVPGTAIVDAERGTATFRRDGAGHFEVVAEVNGERIPMIFDTGATTVVLTTEDARRAGVDTAALNFSIPVSTANGVARAAAIRLDTIAVGGIARNRIPAMVAESGALDTSLLGMTYLETLESYTVSSNSLILTD
jgi:aspartyl protease family protein